MRVAIIGAGRQGARRASAILEHGDKVARVIDSDVGLARTLAGAMGGTASADWREGVNDPSVDAVVVCVPNHMHAQVTIAAIRRGKHVLCEKPLARTPDEALRVVQAARGGGVVVKCGYNLRYHPALARAKALFDAQAIGRLLYLRSTYGITGRPGYEKDWRTNTAIAGGGELMDQGIHVLDLFRWFAGEFDKVVGQTATLYWKIEPSEDNAFAILSKKNGSVGFMHVSWTEWKNLFSFEVFGEEGYIRVEGLGGSYGNETLAVCRKDLSAPFKEEITEFRGPDRSWLEEWKDFAESIRHKRFSADGAVDGWAGVRLAYAIYKSSESGRAVEISH